MLKLRGKITKILEPEVIKTKNGKLYKQCVIMDNNPTYENEIMFQFLGESMPELDFEEGQAGEMQFYINGRKWKDRYFVNLNAKKFEADVSISMGEEIISEFETSEEIVKDEKDDLPF